MMFSANQDFLSNDELRERLYKRFKDKVVQEMLKSQLRTKPQAFTGKPAPRSAPVKTDANILSVCNFIVADYLHRSGYEYTISVFRPESYLDTEKTFKKEALIQFLELSPQSSLYTALLMNEEQKDQGFLINLLTQVTQCHTPHLHYDAATQTTTASGAGSQVVKMKMTEREFDVSREGDQFLFQTKLDAYKRETETPVQMDVYGKMQYFIDLEIDKMRMEVKVQFQKEFDTLRQELEKTYEIEANELSAKENDMKDRLRKQEQQERQTLLKEMEAMQHQVNELRRNIEAFTNNCKIHDKNVLISKELLKSRELLTKAKKDTHDHKLQNELSKYEFQLRENYIRREKITESEHGTVLEILHFSKELTSINARAEEHSTIFSEVRQLQDKLVTAQQKTSWLNQQNAQLREKIESMSDYLRLKNEKAQLEDRERLLTTQLEDIRRENQHLSADLEKPSKEHRALQMELQKLQSEHRLEKEVFYNQKQFLQAQLGLEVERCGQLKVQLTECEDNLQWLTDHVENLQKRLNQNQEFKTCPQAVIKSSCSRLDLNANKQACSKTHKDGTMQRSPTSVPKQRDSCGINSINMVLGAEPSAWILQVQKEADAFQEAYRKLLVGCPSRHHDSAVETHIFNPPHPYLISQSKICRDTTRDTNKIL
ncbi:centriole and centriolar satellite protein ofd1-like [Nerophis lumbriciformis]|uniref:centriole and centriolar satellite protein ofd1-like n=1 Tax=Nerophis lumbriciformis TaxID=546530 RepID=UPI003BA8727F